MKKLTLCSHCLLWDNKLQKLPVYYKYFSLFSRSGHIRDHLFLFHDIWGFVEAEMTRENLMASLSYSVSFSPLQCPNPIYTASLCDQLQFSHNMQPQSTQNSSVVARGYMRTREKLPVFFKARHRTGIRSLLLYMIYQSSQSSQIQKVVRYTPSLKRRSVSI